MESNKSLLFMTVVALLYVSIAMAFSFYSVQSLMEAYFQEGLYGQEFYLSL